MKSNLALAEKMEKDLNKMTKIGTNVLGDMVEENGFGIFADDDPRAAQFLMLSVKLMKDSIESMKKQAETLDNLELKMGELETSLKELTKYISNLTEKVTAPAESK